MKTWKGNYQFFLDATQTSTYYLKTGKGNEPILHLSFTIQIYLQYPCNESEKFLIRK